MLYNLLEKGGFNVRKKNYIMSVGSFVKLFAILMFCAIFLIMTPQVHAASPNDGGDTVFHGFCIGWVLFILVVLQVIFLCFLFLLPLFNKMGKLLGKNNLFSLIGLGTSILVLVFSIMVIADHSCAVAIVSSVLSAFVCIIYIFIMIVGIYRVPAKR